MELFPAVDLRAGRCVRLRQGDYADETVYSDDPVAMVEAFARAGAAWIHVVDLDAARTGEPVNRPVVAAMCAAAAAFGVAVQSGGGVRSHAAASALLEAGAARVVVGTKAVQDPAFVRELAVAHPGAIAVGLDTRTTPDGVREVAAHGWTVGSGVALGAALEALADAGAVAVIVTDIGRDGMLTGPDIDGLDFVLGATPMQVIASGGVSSLDDLRVLRGLRSGGRSLAGAIAGKAIYERRFDVAAAVAACRGTVD